MLVVIICIRERERERMEASCSMTQASASCGVAVRDGDTLDVEHELSRWLRELDTSVSRSSGRLSVLNTSSF